MNAKILVAHLLAAAALLLPQAAAADDVTAADVIPSGGYQTCSVPANRIVKHGGRERPADAAYAKVCLAMLPPTCRNWVMNKQPCAYRACVVDLRLDKCPSGEMTAYVAKEVLRFTEADYAAMNANVMAAVPGLVHQWGGSAPGDTAAGQATQTQILHDQMEAGNGGAGGVTYSGH